MASKKDRPREKFDESVLRTDERIDLLETIHEMVEKVVEEVVERKFNSEEVQHMFNQQNKRS